MRLVCLIDFDIHQKECNIVVYDPKFSYQLFIIYLRKQHVKHIYYFAGETTKGKYLRRKQEKLASDRDESAVATPVLFAETSIWCWTNETSSC